MKVKRLKRLFERLRDSYSAAGADEPAGDMQRVAGLFSGHEDRAVDEFVAETKRLLDGQSSTTEQTIQVADELAAKYIRKLLEAGTDQSVFDTVMDDLESDAEVRKIELFAIANGYRNEPSGGTYVTKFKSLKQARESIREVFLGRLDAQSKRGVIDKLTKRAS
jgi:hypothetical protein